MLIFQESRNSWQFNSTVEPFTLYVKDLCLILTVEKKSKKKANNCYLDLEFWK